MKRHSRERLRQHEFGFTNWGGKRRGAGRKPKGERALVSHVKRPRLAARYPVLLTLKLRYKHPEGDVSTLMSSPVKDNTQKFSAASQDFKFAAAVASFGMLLRGSEHKGDANYDAVLEIATDGARGDETGYRAEFLEIVKKAKELTK